MAGEMERGQDSQDRWPQLCSSVLWLVKSYFTFISLVLLNMYTMNVCHAYIHTRIVGTRTSHVMQPACVQARTEFRAGPYSFGVHFVGLSHLFGERYYLCMLCTFNGKVFQLKKFWFHFILMRKLTVIIRFECRRAITTKKCLKLSPNNTQPPNTTPWVIKSDHQKINSSSPIQSFSKWIQVMRVRMGEVKSKRIYLPL